MSKHVCAGGGGGGGSVTIGQCISICMGHSGGDRYFTVGGSRLPRDLVLLRVTRAGLVASPAVTRNGILFSLSGVLEGSRRVVVVYQVKLCKPSSKYPETHIS